MTNSADDRRAFILDQIARTQMVKVSELSDRFGVSEVSIRRDLNWLERVGLLQRVHGGAVAIPRVALSQSYTESMRSHGEEKERIGRAAAQFIQDGDYLIFDAGTTVLQVARHIPGELLALGNLTVIADSLPIVHELGHCKGVHLILLGGLYLPDCELFAGPLAMESLSKLHADIIFLGAYGLSLSHGVSATNMLEAELDRAMAQAATEVIVVADSSKIGVVGLTTILPIGKIDKLVTDTGAPSEFVTALEDQGVEVIKA
jgi:DeoR/GlpR family transcriptional regulator of sugar metabolism